MIRPALVLNFIGRYTFAVAFAARTFTLGLLSPRRRYLIAKLAKEGGYPDYPRPGLPRVRIEDLTSDRTCVCLANPNGVIGNVTLLELVVLSRLARERSPAAIFEIGTFNGRTTVALAENSPEDARVFTLDLPSREKTEHALIPKERAFVEKNQHGELIAHSPANHKVVQLFGDSARFDFQSYSADLIFIDGSHEFDAVLTDSRNAIQLLRGGCGMIVWHDYGEWEGVTRALDTLYRADPRFAALRSVEGTSLAVLDLH